MKKYLGHFLFLLSISATCTFAEVRFAPIFTDNMVIQQGLPIKIYGTESVPNSKLKIKFAGKAINVVPDKDGYWEAIFKPMKGSFSKYSIQSEVKYDKEKNFREVKNVYVGDVWLCAGQENMDASISKFPHIKSKLLEVENLGLKFTSIKKAISTEPKKAIEHDQSTKKKWQPCKFGDALWAFSAMAYIFGKKLTVKPKFPVGLIEVSHNTPIESWIPKEEYLAAGFKEKLIKNKDGKVSPKSSSVTYNAIVHPLTKLNFKGILWSHGHANSLEPLEYEKLLKTLLSSWRKKFNNPALPFFIAQTAPHQGNSVDKSGESLAWLRDAQAKILTIPNTGLAVLTDAGELNSAVSQEKRKAGERLALWALKLTKKSTPTLGPTIKKVTPGSSHIIIEFNNAGKGLTTAKVVLNKATGKAPGTDPGAAIADAKEIKGFQIAGTDGVFQEANAKISGSRIQLSSKMVRRPVYARYAWTNFPVCNVYNSFGLPMLPFRTDKLQPPNFDGSFPTSPVNLVTASGEQMKLKLLKDQKIQTENIGEGRGILFQKSKKESAALYSVESSDFQKGKSPKTDITIVFFDKDSGYLTVSYDSSEKADKGSKSQFKNYKLAGKIKLRGTGTWQYAKFSVNDAYFGKRLANADLKISTINSNMIIAGVFLDKSK